MLQTSLRSRVRRRALAEMIAYLACLVHDDFNRDGVAITALVLPETTSTHPRWVAEGLAEFLRLAPEDAAGGGPTTGAFNSTPPSVPPNSDPPMTLAIDRLHLAAAAIAATHPEAAALLRQIAIGAHPPTPDPNALKRTVLRRLWRQHHGGLEEMPRCDGHSGRLGSVCADTGSLLSTRRPPPTTAYTALARDLSPGGRSQTCSTLIWIRAAPLAALADE